MEGANAGCEFRNLQVRCGPIEVWVGGKQAIEVISPLFVAFAIWQYQQFRHRDRGGESVGTSPLEPGKDQVGKCEIPWIGFKMINEDAGVQSDSLMAPEKITEPFYFQLWRSFFR